MTEELLYTSAPRGLKPGSSGFCTVVSTQGMSAPLAQALEALSGYRHLYQPGEDRAALNPVAFSHLRLQAGGKTYSVVSRVADYGLDYSQRSNKLAHHVVVEVPERPPAGPAWLMSQNGFLQDAWDGKLRVLPEGRTVPQGDVGPARCLTWQQVLGDAGWAGVLAEAFLEDPERLAILRFAPGQPILPLLAEAIALLPPERRWDVTFSTYFTALPKSATCQWRCVVEGSPEANDSRRFVRALQLDLTRKAGQAAGGSLVETARTGRASSLPTGRRHQANVIDIPTADDDFPTRSRSPVPSRYHEPSTYALSASTVAPPPPMPGTRRARRRSKWKLWLAALSGAVVGIALIALGLVYALKSLTPSVTIAQAEPEESKTAEKPDALATSPTVASVDTTRMELPDASSEAANRVGVAETPTPTTPADTQDAAQPSQESTEANAAQSKPPSAEPAATEASGNAVKTPVIVWHLRGKPPEPSSQDSHTTVVDIKDQLREIGCDAPDLRLRLLDPAASDFEHEFVGNQLKIKRRLSPTQRSTYGEPPVLLNAHVQDTSLVIAWTTSSPGPDAAETMLLRTSAIAIECGDRSIVVAFRPFANIARATDTPHRLKTGIPFEQLDSDTASDSAMNGFMQKVKDRLRVRNLEIALASDDGQLKGGWDAMEDSGRLAHPGLADFLGLKPCSLGHSWTSRSGKDSGYLLKWNIHTEDECLAPERRVLKLDSLYDLKNDKRHTEAEKNYVEMLYAQKVEKKDLVALSGRVPEFGTKMENELTTIVLLDRHYETIRDSVMMNLCGDAKSAEAGKTDARQNRREDCERLRNVLDDLFDKYLRSYRNAKRTKEQFDRLRAAVVTRASIGYYIDLPDQEPYFVELFRVGDPVEK